MLHPDLPPKNRSRVLLALGLVAAVAVLACCLLIVA